MTFASFENAVARDHRQRITQRVEHDLFSHRKDCDHAAGLTILLKRLFRESFAGRRPLQVFVVDTENFLPAFVEDRRLDVSHARDIRIAFGGDVEPAYACFAECYPYIAGMTDIKSA